MPEKAAQDLLQRPEFAIGGREDRISEIVGAGFEQTEALLPVHEESAGVRRVKADILPVVAIDPGHVAVEGAGAAGQLTIESAAGGKEQAPAVGDRVVKGLIVGGGLQHQTLEAAVGRGIERADFAAKEHIGVSIGDIEIRAVLFHDDGGEVGVTVEQTIRPAQVAAKFVVELHEGDTERRAAAAGSGTFVTPEKCIAAVMLPDALDRDGGRCGGGSGACAWIAGEWHADLSF